MTKAKIGDQRFKKKSYLPYIIAALSVLFVIVGSIFALSSIFRAEDISLQSQMRGGSPNTPGYVKKAIELWEHPIEKPSYLLFTPAASTISQGTRICFELRRDDSVRENPDPVRARVDVDGIAWGVYFTMEWDKAYCFTPMLAKGYHLIQMKQMAAAQWGILIE
jgi:hypothetical protein